MAIEEYANVKEGSGDALLEVLVRFAKSTHHAELSGAPLFLWGISAGGEFNYEFACWKPDRVAAFVVNKGGVYYTALCSPEARKVPGLFFTGADDMEFRSRIIEGIFAINRRFGALWAFAEEPCTKHEIGSSKALSIMFFGDIMQMRIPERITDVHQPVELLCIKEEDGYVGDFKLKEYYPFIDRKEIGYPTAWLPGREFAEVWLSLIKGNCSIKPDNR
jgi:pimeloyl-ACP methyl ester carboxylesterase